MLRRLFLALLALCLALPAAAMPLAHDAPAPSHHAASAAHDHSQSAPAPADGARHECIGCIVRLDGIGAPPPRVSPGPIAPHAPPVIPFAGSHRRPDVPPPRA